MLLWRNATLFSENFKDSENGWQKHFDVESFVYQNEVQSMKLWIQERFEWLKQQFDAM